MSAPRSQRISMITFASAASLRSTPTVRTAFSTRELPWTWLAV